MKHFADNIGTGRAGPSRTSRFSETSKTTGGCPAFRMCMPGHQNEIGPSLSRFSKGGKHKARRSLDRGLCVMEFKTGCQRKDTVSASHP